MWTHLFSVIGTQLKSFEAIFADLNQEKLLILFANEYRHGMHALR